MLLWVPLVLPVDGKKLNVLGSLLLKALGVSLDSSPFFAFAAARKSNLGVSLLPKASWVAGFELILNVGVELGGFCVVKGLELGRPKVVDGKLF